MPKLGLKTDVLSAAEERVVWTFDNFKKVYLSFSAGKDSTVLLHLVAAEARKRKRKFGLLLIDLEAQYKLTIKHAQDCFDLYSDCTEPFWCCLPIHLRNAVSVYQTHWVCWDEAKRDVWVRDLPDKAIRSFPFSHFGMEFEEFTPAFGEWYANGTTTACLVGIRANESLNRFRTIASTDKQTIQGKQWVTRVQPNTGNVYNIYPIYDWRTEDVWTFHARTGLPYNQLYDLMWKAGLTIHQMRICQPYGDDQRKGLWLFHIIEPETWAKIVARVNGANTGALYVQDAGNIMGNRRINKPEGHSWRSFADLLVNSMPARTKEHYENKIATFRYWWTKRGYPEPQGIPDEADIAMEMKRQAPSWRRVCKALLRNDYWAKGLGFSQHRSGAYEKYLALMRRRKQEWNLT